MSLKVFVWVLAASLSAGAQVIPGRFIVEFEGEPLAGLKARVEQDKSVGRERGAAVVRDHASRIRARHEGVRSILAQRKIGVRGTIDTVGNAVMVENATEEQLRDLPGVVRIRPVRYLRKQLDHAIPLMRFPEAWEKVGGASQAGAGIKIGIIDTGVDHNHAGFRDASLTAPEGFPLLSVEGNREFTNGKVIVARSYGANARDRDGHGTGVAMIAAGVGHEISLSIAQGTISGAAPKAFVGNYNPWDSNVGGFPTDSLMLAIEDAVKDGMDVINLSLGSPGLNGADDSDFTPLLNQAMAAGVLVVVAASNDGPDISTIGDPGLVPKAITVGASPNDRIPSGASLLVGDTRLNAAAASNSSQAQAVSAKLIDIGSFDPTRLGCGTYPEGSLAGRVAVVQRGDCLFTEKFANARIAGAAAIVVYNNVEGSELVVMSVDEETLPGLFLSSGDGQRLRELLGDQAEPEAILNFAVTLPDDPNRVVSGSSRGPTPDLLIKPDLLAVGGNVVTAVSGTNPNTSSYAIASGTSLASPLVAGAAAVLKQARPGLTVDQYRSLLINTATPLPKLAVQESGAGIANLAAALDATFTSDPVSVSFGEAFKGTPAEREVTLTNLGAGPETYTIQLVSNDALKPSLSTDSLAIAPGQTGTFKLTWQQTEPPPGAYQGYIEVTAAGGTVLHMPYWLAVRGNKPTAISWSYSSPNPRPDRVATVIFRIIDVSSLSLEEPQPEVTVTSGGGEVLDVEGFVGLFLARIRLGPEAGLNVVQVKVGDSLERTLQIRSSN
jgi:subtilisin family serine protease